MRRIKSVLFSIIIIGLFTVLAGCSGSSGSSIVVTVCDQSGNKPGVTVVLGNSDGAMKNQGTTDANGQIVFPDPPANATVTAAFSCLYSGATTTTYSLDIRYDVNGPVTLRVDGCPPPSDSYTGSTALGTVTLNVTNAISGITQNEVSTNQRLYLGYKSLITQQTITITPYDLQADGKLSIFVIGKDANDTSIAYGYLLDQTFTNGMTVNITVDQPLSFVQYQISNIPSTANSLCTDLDQGRAGKGGVWVGDCHDLSSAATSTTVNVPYIPGLGDQFLYGVYVSSYQYNGNTSISSYQYLSPGPFAPTLSNQSFDFNEALAAPSLTVSGTDTPTPTLSWNGVDPDATRVRFFAALRLSSGSNFYLSVYDLNIARTSITFPELPDSLAASRPTAVSFFSVDTATDSGAFRSSGGTYYQF